MLLILKTISTLRSYLGKQEQQGGSIGFVPTMGALHEGHLQLIRTSKDQQHYTVCSIFVNPTQFNDKKDFDKYPKTIESDIEKLQAAGCDLLFLPSVEELYPGGLDNLETYEIGKLETIYEGEFRPGHFQGVCQVVRRLLDAVRPHHLFMGQKDYQQCMVIKRLLEIQGMNIKFTAIPTVREPNGLAMSSRNMRLSEENREKASFIHKTLTNLCHSISAGNIDQQLNIARTRLSGAGFRIDYIDIADASTLEPVRQWDGRQQLVALAAVFIQEVRLIDNVLNCGG